MAGHLRMDSDDESNSAHDLMASFRSKASRPSNGRQTQTEAPASHSPPAQATPGRPAQRDKEASFSPGMFISDASSQAEEDVASPVSQNRRPAAYNRFPIVRKAIAVRVSPVSDVDEYIPWAPEETVASIEREFHRRGEMVYDIKLTNGGRKVVGFEDLLTIDDGPIVLKRFHNEASDSASEAAEQSDATERSEDDDMRLRKPKARNAKRPGFVDITQIHLSGSEDELVSGKKRLRQSRLLVSNGRRSSGRSSRAGRSRRSEPIELSSDDNSSDSDEAVRRRGRKRKNRPQEHVRRSSRAKATPQRYDDEEEEEEDSSDMDILRSDVLQGQRKRKRGRPSSTRQQASEKLPRTGVRQSGRSTRAQNNMVEAGENDIWRDDSPPTQPNLPKVVGVKEVFQTLPRNDPFRARHVEGCETCGSGPNISALIYCQGCCLSYHKNCLGVRSTRDHLVTKIGDEEFVLQCRRCINIPRKKDPTAPDLSKCQDCNVPGASCKPFRKRKTTAQEQKDREDNDGQDPIIRVDRELINNPNNVMFRCTKCSRAYHYHHLPPLSQYSMDIARDEEATADERFAEYSKRWLCKDCEETQKRKVGGIIAWRPSDLETYQPGVSCYLLNEDDKQYLIKWESQSYFRASWHSGSWTWGVTASAMRRAFNKRNEPPKMRTEDAIPEEYLRIDIVLDVKFTSYVEVRSEEIDKARIKEVDKALIKYKGLGYEDAVWETVPTAEDGDRWLDFVTAYNDWVAGRYIRCPKPGPLRVRLEKARGTPFGKLEKKKQPENLVGGELMKYQIEGLNWLYYQWYSLKNGILADEMGLGKTIQVIGFMATLVQEHNCFPFLIVVPNSTCANWRREIKQWVPSLRVVTYFGSAAARDMASRYEMHPEGSKELRCHIVVTSYDAAADDNCRRFFRSVSWAGLIVDEGQRLKNDRSLLYTALKAIKTPFRLLMTGTPLQNNTRELFNLLQFLDESINAADLEERYAEMTTENIRELHEKIRPYILRRTKAQVLTFLPPLAQIIVPLSMSVLQKSLYKSILARNPELLRALFSTNKTLKQHERANLSNILMQLRKCLCHPFVYNQSIEERTDVAAVSHRNLVEASAKLQLLELLLPKLKERGHRVLIFSQFLEMLNMVEDFLDGLEMPYQRLDGTIGSLEKQKRIDQFNAPDSPLFAFLLSTRAGGVGINLATADTVIILDPDFNPHQDVQAVSRAHRIGQKKKVLCFQLMTRASVEEKIVQMGRNKMALDHVVVEQLDAEDTEDKDFESILKFGAAELFKDDNTEHDIRYDDVSIEKLLDRSQLENTKTGGDNSAESQFSFARVWANDQGTLADGLDTPEEEVAPDPGVWDMILKERQAAAAAEALARADALGRGKRARMNVDYKLPEDEAAASKGDNPSVPVSEITEPPKEDSHRGRGRRKKKTFDSDSDTDFQDVGTDGSSEDEAPGDIDPMEVDQPEQQSAPPPTLARTSQPTPQVPAPKQNPSGTSMFPPVEFSVSTKSSSMSEPPKKPMSKGKIPGQASNLSKLKVSGSQIPQSSPTVNLPQKAPSHPFRQSHSSSTLTIKPAPNTRPVKAFARAHLPVRSPLEPNFQFNNQMCYACRKSHPRGACPLKIAGVEHCGLCGLAHFGFARTCPHINSETQVREMIAALKTSPEKKELVDAAMKYLRGVKGRLVQRKKREREKSAGGASASSSAPGGGPIVDLGHPPQISGVPGAHISVPNQPPPTRQSLYHIPGSLGSALSGINGLSSRHNSVANAANHSSSAASVGTSQQQQQQRASQMAGEFSNQPRRPPIDDSIVEGALRGYLGR